MFKKINYYWRILATGISFLAFGLGGLVLRLIVFPLLSLFIWKHALRVYFARTIIRFSFRGFIELMRVLGVLCYDIRGLEKLRRKGLLILANHPTLIDTVFLMAFVKHADCIVKSDLWDNPFTCGPVRAAGYICNDDGSGLIEDCTVSLQKGSNLIIFPEGTRTGREGVIKFKRGAATIALRSLHAITPVVIRCIPPTLTRGEKWWNIPPTRMRFYIDVKDDISVTEYLTVRSLNHNLQNYFMKETDHATT